MSFLYYHVLQKKEERVVVRKWKDQTGSDHFSYAFQRLNEFWNTWQSYGIGFQDCTVEQARTLWRKSKANGFVEGEL